jgi:hypothetical protein
VHEQKRNPRRAIGGLAAMALLLGLSAIAAAEPTQEDVFRSLNESMHESPNYGLVLPWLFAAAGVVAVVVYFRQRQKVQAIPKPLNHPGKLVREMTQLAGVDAAEIKRLKALAKERQVSSPLVLLLCPSLLDSSATEGAEDATESAPASAAEAPTTDTDGPEATA